MLLTSVIIILREVLEAALIISVLLALSRILHVRLTWLRTALPVGAAGAAVYAASTAVVSDWFDGVGQEVLNALMQFSICLSLMLIAVLFGTRDARPKVRDRDGWLKGLMIFSVALATVREGSEILLYLSSFTAEMDLFMPILAGGLAGAGIGVSVGALVYFLLLNVNRHWLPHVGTVLLALIAAGMAGQAALLLIQADWLPSQSPLWDSTAWLAEDSVTGQLLYALIGYEATPTPVHTTIYFAGLLLPLVLVLCLRWRKRNAAPHA